MKSLKEFTKAVESAGCYSPKMERSYKRRDHREVLVFAAHEWRTKGKMSRKASEAEGKSIHDSVCDKLRKAGFELTYDSWSYGDRDLQIVVQAKVALAEGF